MTRDSSVASVRTTSSIWAGRTRGVPDAQAAANSGSSQPSQYRYREYNAYLTED